MWFLILITFLNALANNKQFLLAYRIQIGSLPVNVLDMSMFAGLLLLPLVPGRTAAKQHPALAWILVAYFIAICGGLLMAVMNGLPFRGTVIDLRDVLAVPICLYLGYMYLANERTSERFPAVQALAGVGTALMILLFFLSQGSQAVSAYNDNIDRFRTIEYFSQYSGISAALLLFAVLANIRLFPRPLAIALAGFCFVGQFATLSRSDWIAELSVILLVCFFLPMPQRIRKSVHAVLALVVLALFLWGLIYVTSQLTGRDFHARMIARIQTMLPGAPQRYGQLKAWDTRLPGILEDLKLWSASPILGRGLGIHAAVFGTLGMWQAGSLGHNSWTSTLAQLGIVGVAAALVLFASCATVGWRMVRDRTDRGSVLIGALGVIVAVQMGVLGAETGAFNNLRGGILVGLVCGVVLRCRALQLEKKAQLSHGYDLEEQPLMEPAELYADAVDSSAY